MQHLIEKVLKDTGMTQEQFEQLVQANRDKNPVPVLKTDTETIGNALVVTFQNDNQLGDLVMSLFFQVNDLAMMVMQLQTELEELKNA
jgi:hypothetical protein